MLPHCYPNRELTECMASMILKDSCASEVSSEYVKREEYLYASIHLMSLCIAICLVSANDLGDIYATEVT